MPCASKSVRVPPLPPSSLFIPSFSTPLSTHLISSFFFSLDLALSYYIVSSRIPSPPLAQFTNGETRNDSHRSDPEEFYVKQDRIGKGSFGEVFKGYDKRTQKTDIQQEIQILSQLDSPHVTKYHGSYLKGSHLWIVMEYCSGGSCSDLMKPGVFREEYIAIIIRELLRGLDYLHTEGKLHRDIKAANILLSAGGEVKLADFGVSGQLSGTLSAKKNTFGYDHKADIWSLGITAIELAKGEPPYAELHPMKVLFLIPKNPPPQLDAIFSKTFREFVAYCLQRDPRDRPSARELLKHKFIRMAKKPSYLTELIERHERWKAEGGERHEEETQDRLEDLSATTDPEDLWDFGTVRNTARPGTIGRASSVQVSGPPLTWDYNKTTTRSRGSSGSGSSIKGPNGPRRVPSTETDSVASSNTARAAGLQPLPLSERSSTRRVDQQATVRHGVVGNNEGNGLFPRVSTQEARVALSSLQRAFTEAERMIPGVTMELVNEIVDSVEHVEDGR
ncbi:kinase-like domain-containing protein [Russula vinacea]|nr:kinase-like domain-containing protein [Russula vinacea]